jgi:hypothetical protein
MRSSLSSWVWMCPSVCWSQIRLKMHRKRQISNFPSLLPIKSSTVRRPRSRSTLDSWGRWLRMSWATWMSLINQSRDACWLSLCQHSTTATREIPCWRYSWRVPSIALASSKESTSRTLGIGIRCSISVWQIWSKLRIRLLWRHGGTA